MRPQYQSHNGEINIMFTAILNACQSFLNRVKVQLKKIMKPTTATLTVGAMSDLARNKNDLIVENAMLRQQLIVLKRSVKRPKLTNGDRVRLALLARLTDFWQSALHIIQPDTLLRWHRDLFRWYWRWKSKAKSNQPRIPRETKTHYPQIHETGHAKNQSKLENLPQESRQGSMGL